MMNDMGLPHLKPPVSPEEYLRLEQEAVRKHEYYRGEVFAMAGGSPDHSLLIANIIGALHARLRGKPCRVYDSNLRVRVQDADAYCYPDVSIVCGQREFDPIDVRRQTILNPTLIVEVLSPGTEAFDRGGKWARYEQIPSLKQYVIVSQETPSAETYLRQTEGIWHYSAARGIKASLQLDSIGVALDLSEVYAGVEFPPRAERPAGPEEI